MKTLLAMSLLLFSAQSYALDLATVDNSKLTPEARTAILQYVDENCSSEYPFIPDSLTEEKTEVYATESVEDSVDYTLVSSVIFTFPYSDDYEHTKITIKEYRENKTAPWRAKVVGFNGAYACGQL